MDPVDAIINEIILTQSKNEQLKKIVLQLEHESDVIIKQFEQKIGEVKKDLQHEQDEKARLARRFEASLKKAEDDLASSLEKMYAMETDLLEREHQKTDLLAVHAHELADRDQQVADLISNRDDLLASESRLQEQIRSLKEESNIREERHLQVIADGNEEISSLKEEILSLTRKGEEEQERSAHHLANYQKRIETERLIRNREISERDQVIQSLQADQGQAAEEIHGLSREILAKDDALLRLSGEIVREKEQRTAEQAAWNAERERAVRDLSDLQARLTGKAEELSREREESRRLSSELEVQTSSHAAALLDLQTTLTERAEELSREREEGRRLSSELEVQAAASAAELSTLQGMKAEDEAKIAELSGMIIRLDREIQESAVRLVTLKNVAEAEQQQSQKEKAELLLTLKKMQERSAITSTNFQKKVAELETERDALIYSGEQREEFYRNEINGLHTEISTLQRSLQEHEEQLRAEIDTKNGIISDLTGNNEQIRSELTRVRAQYSHLTDLIRIEKDESVHVLYLEIQKTRELLSGKEDEIRRLSDIAVRLDQENTELNQQISGLMESREEQILPAISERTERDDPVFAGLLADLEDPARAPEATLGLVRYGKEIVPRLIPLLHSGSLQRRIWVAVALYELTDRRATEPLKVLLENPSTQFRELIWEARSRYMVARKNADIPPLSEKRPA